MWETISKFLIDLITFLVSDKVLVEGAKKMIVKAVDSGVEKVGITDEDAQEIIHSITKSTLNNISEETAKHLLK